MLVDSHAHLEMFHAGKERDAVVQRAHDAGVNTILTIGTTLEDSRKNVAIARHYEGVWAAVGVHPHDVKEVEPPQLAEKLARLSEDNKVVAIGEIGLDFYRNISPPAMQIDFFHRQLRLALDLGLPVIIHDRDAHQETMTMLQESNIASVGGVLHCFSGDLRMAEQAVEWGFYISIAGPVTFKKAEELREVAANIPLDRLLLETDCPFLAPVPFRGKRNEPAYVQYTANKVAELRGISAQQIAEQTSENFARLFLGMG